MPPGLWVVSFVIFHYSYNERYTLVAYIHLFLNAQWREVWTSAPVVNQSLVPDPTIRKPGFDLPRHTWSMLNRFRTGRGTCRADLHQWGLSTSESCSCGQKQTMSHIVDSCPLSRFTTTSHSWRSRSSLVGDGGEKSTRETKRNCSIMETLLAVYGRNVCLNRARVSWQSTQTCLSLASQIACRNWSTPVDRRHWYINYTSLFCS